MNSASSQVRSDSGLTLVCVALKQEAVPFQKLIQGRADIAVLFTGIGRANAERAVREFFKVTLPSRVFTCGFAGGLNPELKIGDVLFATEDAALREKLLRNGVRPAKFVCSDRVATTRAEKEQLRASSGADAVEMESEMIQAFCHERAVPCATIRTVSDTAKEDLPLDFNLLSNPDRSLNYGKLTLAVAKAPGRIPALLSLQKQTSLAASNLAAKLVGVLS